MPLRRPAPAHQADTATDGYAALFAEADRAADPEDSQLALFDAQPSPADVVAAQPLHLNNAAGGQGGDTAAEHTAVEHTAVEHTDDESSTHVSSNGDAALTVSQAARRAEIIAELRVELDARSTSTAPTSPGLRGTDPGADELDNDVDLGASRDDIEYRTDITQGQGVSS
jgi:hypothetical protein